MSLPLHFQSLPPYFFSFRPTYQMCSNVLAFSGSWYKNTYGSSPCTRLPSLRTSLPALSMLTANPGFVACVGVWLPLASPPAAAASPVAAASAPPVPSAATAAGSLSAPSATTATGPLSAVATAVAVAVTVAVVVDAAVSVVSGVDASSVTSAGCATSASTVSSTAGVAAAVSAASPWNAMVCVSDGDGCLAP